VSVLHSWQSGRARNSSGGEGAVFLEKPVFRKVEIILVFRFAGSCC
jgi:hypothetical protein